MPQSDNRRTIVVYSCFYEPYISGAERFVKEVEERLAGRYKIIILSARLSRKNSRREIKEVGGNRYEIRRLGLGFKFDKWLYPILAPLATFAYRPKLIHAVMESYAGVALVFYKYIGGRARTILTLQSGDLDDKNKQKKIPAWLWKKIHTRPDYVTAISTFLRDRALRLGASPDRVLIIPNGVDFTAADKYKSLKKETHRLVSVARLSWEKGLDYLIEAMPKIKRDFPDVRLRIVGGGPLEKKLKQKTKELGMETTITFLGNQPHEKTLREVAQAEVFITPSLAEGLGIVFIEAQAVGTPAIGTAIGGIPDVIQNEKTGLLIRARDADAIYAAVKKLFENKNLREKVTDQAWKKLNRFDWKIIARQVSDLYKSILSEV